LPESPEFEHIESKAEGGLEPVKMMDFQQLSRRRGVQASQNDDAFIGNSSWIRHKPPASDALSLRPKHGEN
jgi:hypothetical protein